MSDTAARSVPIARSDRSVVEAVGDLVVKTRLLRGRRERCAFRRELAVNRGLGSGVPGLVVPALVGFERARRRLWFERIEGGPVAEKYPRALGDADLDRLLEAADLVAALDLGYRRRWALDVPAALRRYAAAGALPRTRADRVVRVWRQAGAQTVFAHGDLIPRNVFRLDDGRTALIDWEFAGWFPPGYDLASLWFCLGAVPGARALVERRAERYGPDFWVGAVLVHARHAEMWSGLPSRRAVAFFGEGYHAALDRACA